VLAIPEPFGTELQFWKRKAIKNKEHTYKVWRKRMSFMTSLSATSRNPEGVFEKNFQFSQ
jgi:hypothetical protein